MAETCYPVFQEGQTLTRDDLTLLRDFLDDRARQVARAVGFGISCSLDGEIVTSGGPALVVSPGVAITPSGRHLFSANQNADRITIFARDIETGALADTGRAIEIGTPMCIKFAPATP